MTKVLLLGDRKDKKLAAFLLKYLSKFFHVCFYHDSDLIEDFGKGRDLLVIQTNSVHRAFSENTIVVLLPSARMEFLSSATKSVLFVVRSTMGEQLKYLAQKDLSAITCGLSGKDTITVSSHFENRMTIALQRELKTVEKTVVEPLELPFQLSEKVDWYHVMTLAALLLLTGAIDLEKLGELPIIYL